MLIIISPAKKLDNKTKQKIKNAGTINFVDESKEIATILKEYKPADLSALMSISPKLGELNFERFLKWEYPFKSNEAGKAIHMFQGDVYTSLQAENFSDDNMLFAQKHLRILSGLYGVLRPMDLILPYRLEMGTKLKTEKGKNLYEFWGNKINKKIQDALNDQEDNILINLASNEYFKSVKAKDLSARIITPAFKEYKNGSYKIISFFAKKARGLMSRYIITNKLTDPEDLIGFDYDKYSYNDELSSKDEFVFTR